MYTGHAHWDEIAALKAALDIPVIGNGDIKTAADALRMREQTGCDGVMIARGSFGQPWIFRQARALLDGQPMPAGGMSQVAQSQAGRAGQTIPRGQAAEQEGRQQAGQQPGSEQPGERRAEGRQGDP